MNSYTTLSRCGVVAGTRVICVGPFSLDEIGTQWRIVYVEKNIVWLEDNARVLSLPMSSLLKYYALVE